MDETPTRERALATLREWMPPGTTVFSFDLTDDARRSWKRATFYVLRETPRELPGGARTTYLRPTWATGLVAALLELRVERRGLVMKRGLVTAAAVVASLAFELHGDEGALFHEEL